ncbi:hypothetical protein F5883DRAFT_142713 [Diaporthe sp. PMI_573]|nr:hypothetical protein F5883DRAFT_142713 [Diaporthaceae sp. PMI_573]
MASIWGITKPSSQPGTSLADTSSESLGSASPPSFKHVRFSTHLPPPTGHQPEFIVINEGRDRGVGRDQDPSPPQIVLQDAAGKGAATAAATARAPKATSATDEATSIAVPATADELGIPSSSRPPDSGRPQPSGSGPASPPVPASQDAEGTPERPGAPPSGVVAELGPPPIPAARVQAGPSPAPRRVRIRAPSTKASSRSSASSSSSSGSTRSHQSLNTRRTLLPHQGAASMFSEGNLSGFYDGLRAAYERSVFRVKDGTSRHEGKKSNGASSIVINLASIHRMYLLTLRYKLVKLALELRYRKPSSGGRKTKQGRDEDDDGSSSSSGSSGSEGGESITRSTEDSDSDDSEDDSDSDSDDPIKSFFDGYPSSALYEYGKFRSSCRHALFDSVTDPIVAGCC